MRDRRSRASVWWIALASGLCAARAAGAATYVVPDDFATIQAALDAALPGDTVEARQQAAPYHEKLAFPTSGDAVHGFITVQAYPGDHPVLDGTGVSGANMVLIDTRSYVKVIGFEIRNIRASTTVPACGCSAPARTSRSATTTFTASAAATPWASRSTPPLRRPSTT